MTHTAAPLPSPAGTSLSYTLAITGAPYASQAPQTALAVAKALVAAGHRIDRLFLYGEGVLLASSLNCPPSDETDWTREWCTFLADHRIPAITCIASALRRGLLDEREQARYQKTASNLASPFILAGLGDWVEGMNASDRLLHFNGNH